MDQTTHDLLMDWLLPIFFGIMAIIIIWDGAKVAIKRRPIVRSGNKMGVFFIIYFLPLIASRLLDDRAVDWAAFLNIFIWVGLVFFLWHNARDYIVVGLTTNSTKDVLSTVLNERKLEWKEDFLSIHIPSENLKIQVESVSNAVRVRNVTKQNKEKFEQIMVDFKNALAVSHLPVVRAHSFAQMLMGVLLIGLAVLMFVV